MREGNTMRTGHAHAQQPTIEPNGREYLVMTPDGTVFVALTLPEAEAIASLWRSRTRPER